MTARVPYVSATPKPKPSIPLETVLVLHGVGKETARKVAKDAIFRRGNYQWLAQDGSGFWYLYYKKPSGVNNVWRRWIGGGFHVRLVQTPRIDNYDTLLIDISNLR